MSDISADDEDMRLHRTLGVDWAVLKEDEDFLPNGWHAKIWCFPGWRFALGFHVELDRWPDWFISGHIAWFDIHFGYWKARRVLSRS